MNDIRVFAKNEKEQETIIQTIRYKNGISSINSTKQLHKD